jgi:uncharacterized protein
MFRSLVIALGMTAGSTAAVAQRHVDAPAAPPSENAILSKLTEVRIPMADGVTLAGDLYLPAKQGRYPLIIEMTPYGKRSPLSFVNERDYWTAQGYAFLIVDIRGRNQSQGQFGYMRDGPDGRDVVEWAARQPWSDGKVGMRGASYSGTIPWLTAKLKPPHLRCINANASVASPFHGPPYMGGAFMQEWALGWIANFTVPRTMPAKPVDHQKLIGHRPLITADVAAHGMTLPTYRAFLNHPRLDEYWRATTLTKRDYQSIDIPALAFTGWFDGTLQGTVQHYQNMKRYSPAANDQFLIVGPWQHQTVSDGGWDFESGERVSKVGDLTLPAQAFLPGQKITTEFFDWCLKGKARPTATSARMYITGANRWIEVGSFNQGNGPVSFYLGKSVDASSSGRNSQLFTAPPPNGKASYIFDPANPVPSYLNIGGARRTLVSEPVDISSQLDRDDVLIYTSTPLSKPLTVLGNISVELFAASSARDTDFVIRLEDVAPDGTAFKLGSANGGVLRARYRNGFNREALLTPNRPARMTVNLGEIGHQFAAGHRLRISITSSSYPMISINPNTGDPIASDTSVPVKAKQTVYYGDKWVSRLIVPSTSR